MKTLDILKGFIFCFKLIGKYDYLYVDFSFKGLDKDYYQDLNRYLKSSDFMINLTGVESYNKYLQINSESPYFSVEEKDGFCSGNAGRFVFGEDVMVERLVAVTGEK